MKKREGKEDWKRKGGYDIVRLEEDGGVSDEYADDRVKKKCRI